ncbi:MAG TPA: hypothetical protein VF137_00605 [Candidatus Dormibacteraeota bacterium]
MLKPLSLAVAALLVTACTGADQGASSQDTSAGLADFLPAAPGSGLPSQVETQQVLDIDTASTAVPTPADATKAELLNLRYKAGYGRIWGTSTDYVTMLALAFPSPDGAAGFAAFERQGLTGAQNTFVTSHADIPGSFVFVISSPTQASGNENSEICNGVWFAYHANAYESLACGTLPNWATQIEQAAKNLYQRVRLKAG